jgi:hypothetical protein
MSRCRLARGPVVKHLPARYGYSSRLVRDGAPVGARQRHWSEGHPDQLGGIRVAAMVAAAFVRAEAKYGWAVREHQAWSGTRWRRGPLRLPR